MINMNMDRQTYRQIDTHIDGHTDRQIDRQTDRQKYRQTEIARQTTNFTWSPVQL